MNQEPTLRRAIVEVGRLLYERKYVIATDGNISTRLGERHILITPSGFCKGFITPDDLLVVPLAGHPEPAARSRPDDDEESAIGSPSVLKPSSETPMHAAIYAARPDINAIVHAHPPYLTSFAVSGRRLDAGVLPETRLFDGPVGRVPQLAPGSNRLAVAAAQALRKHNACLLSHHGAVALGDSLLAAYYRLERLELLAQVSLLRQRS